MASLLGVLPLFGEPKEGADLLSRVAAGSTSALADAYDAHAERVYAFSRRLIGDAAAAEDLVHEVFLVLPSAARRYRGDANIRTFLLSIAHNCARHHVRAAARRRAAMSRLESESSSHAETTPHSDAVRKQLAERLQRALDQLSLEQRVAFVLCEVEGHSSTEASAIVGVPEGTVRTRVFHAKKKLRAWLEREEHP